jgi:hypothetical protein
LVAGDGGDSQTAVADKFPVFRGNQIEGREPGLGRRFHELFGAD